MKNINNKFLSIVIITVAFFYSSFNAQSIYTQKDVDICNSKFKLAIDDKIKSKPINEIIVEIGKSFIGTDYVAHTLEKGEKESVVINLEGLDCYTFLESTLALSLCIKNGKTTFNDYLKQIENLRYRNGEMKEYPSRLHYFSDWLYDVDKRGIGKDITKEIGGELIKKRINFMSNHVSSYKQLKANPQYVKEIVLIENEITNREYHWIPQKKIASIEKKINQGDLIGITTNVDGLDIAHVGIAVRMDNGRIHFMHAPIVGYKVQITEKPLNEYIAGNKKQNGIMVFRVN